MSIRTDVAQLIREALADGPLADIKIVTSERDIGKIGRAAIIVKQQSIGRLPAAPLSHRNVGVIVTVISAHQDLDRAEDDLDVIVPDVLNALDNQAILTWSGAAKVGWGESNLAYDITLEVIADKE